MWFEGNYQEYVEDYRGAGAKMRCNRIASGTSADTLKGRLSLVCNQRSAGASSRRANAVALVGPLAALLVFAGVVLVLHHQLARLHIRSVFEHLHSIPRTQVLAALGFTALSYWLLTTYEVLALRYLRRAIPYSRILFTRSSPTPSGTRSVRRLYRSGDPLPAVRDRGHYRHRVATISAFCSLSLGIGWRRFADCRCSSSPRTRQGAAPASPLVGAGGRAAAGAVIAYALWACLARGRLEIRAGRCAPGSGDRTCADRALVMDLSLSSAVLWWLLPPQTHIDFVTSSACTRPR